MKTFSSPVLFLSLFLIIALPACEKESNADLLPPGSVVQPWEVEVCADSVFLSPIRLLPESKDFFHHDGITKAVFVNELGHKAEFFNRVTNSYYTVRIADYTSCPANDFEEIFFTYSAERAWSEFTNDSLDLEIDTYMYSTYDFYSSKDSLAYDRMYVTMRRNNSNDFLQSAYLLTAQRDLPYDDKTHSVHYFPELEILGKKYQDVYTTDDEGNVLFFTKDQGIIAFHDLIGNIWRLDYLR